MQYECIYIREGCSYFEKERKKARKNNKKKKREKEEGFGQIRPREGEGEKYFSSSIPSNWKVLYNMEELLEYENHAFGKIHDLNQEET